MIRLHQYPPIWNLSSLSPFCVKVETYLRMTEVAFETVLETRPSKGPRGRMPFIEDGKKTVSDSRLIIDYLERKSLRPLDAILSPEQKAISFAFHRMIEQDLIRVILYSRWVDLNGWKSIRKEFEPLFPFGLRTLALTGLRRSLQKEAVGGGITEFSREEIYHLGERHLSGIAEFLKQKVYFFGDQPATLDAALFAFLFVILETPIEVPLRKFAQSQPNLLEYCQRIRTKYFPINEPNLP